MNIQQGQALPLGLALTMIATVAMLVLFKTGSSTVTKARLANTADAAAYSGLQWQARSLNFQAYANRAMVANQVAVAQAVSLRSWADYGERTSRNLNRVLGSIPYLGQVTQAMESSMASAEAIVAPLSTGMVDILTHVNEILSEAQEAMYLATFVGTSEAVDNIVVADDPQFVAQTSFGIGSALDNLREWSRFTDRFDTSDANASRRRADVINRSLDPFSRERDWRFFRFWFPTSPITRARIEREGGTRLLETTRAGETHWEWQARDTVSLAHRTWIPFQGTARHELPIGWGAAYANSVGEQSLMRCGSGSLLSHGLCQDWFSRNRVSQRLAEGRLASSGSRLSTEYAGMQAYRTLSELTASQEHPRLELSVEVSSPADSLSSVSIAEVFYERPDGDSRGPVQNATAYNPFWEVRLKRIPLRDRLLAMAMRGNRLLPAGHVNSLQDGRISGVSGSGQNSLIEGDRASSDSAAFREFSEALGVDDVWTIDAVPSEVNVELSAPLGELTAYVNQHTDPGLESARDVMENQLRNALSDAGERLLSAAADSAFGQSVSVSLQQLDSTLSDLEAAAQQQLGRSEPLVEQLGEIVHPALVRANEFVAEFNAMRLRIARRYELSWTRTADELDARLRAIPGDIRELEEELTRASEEERDDLLSRINSLRQEVRDSSQALLERRALALMRIVEEETETIQLSLEQALRVVRAAGDSGDAVLNILRLEPIDADGES